MVILFLCLPHLLLRDLPLPVDSAIGEYWSVNISIPSQSRDGTDLASMFSNEHTLYVHLNLTFLLVVPSSLFILIIRFYLYNVSSYSRFRFPSLKSRDFPSYFFHHFHGTHCTSMSLDFITVILLSCFTIWTISVPDYSLDATP